MDVAFWGLLGYGCAFMIWGESVGIKELVVAVIPYIKGARWFVRDYIIMILCAPFLNNCLTRLSKREYKLLLVLLLLVFSDWPSFFPNPPIDDYGFSCVHFIQLYAIAGYLKLHLDKSPKPLVCAACYLGSVALIFCSAIMGMGYALFRMFCELFRAPDAHIGFLTSWGLTMGQLLSGIMFFCGFAIFMFAIRKK